MYINNMHHQNNYFYKRLCSRRNHLYKNLHIHNHMKNYNPYSKN